MDPRRWARIESLYHAALAKTPDERPRYLVAVCAEEPEILREVDLLLDCADAGHHSKFKDCLFRPIIHVHLSEMAFWKALEHGLRRIVRALGQLEVDPGAGQSGRLAGQSFIRIASCAPRGPPSETRAPKRGILSVRPTRGLLPPHWSCRLR
jgi:hypothetical protein